MPSEFFKNYTERKTIKEQLSDLARRSAVAPTGKVKNMKSQYSDAKKKAGTTSGSQRGS